LAPSSNANIAEISRKAFIRTVGGKYDPEDALEDPKYDKWLDRMEESLKTKRLNGAHPMIFVNGWVIPDIDEVPFYSS
jgi:hypothetical protein